MTCVWLMPFYPTADRDDGYDITDQYAIDPRLGTFGDFTEFMRTARDRGLRVIIDLVVNHTSSEHPWFQAARRSRESRYREYYVWRDEVPADGPEGVVFPGRQEGVWSYDAEAGQYYLHRFYAHQPDLDVTSAAVRDEIRKILGFWLAQGISGFRVDAVPFLLETDGAAGGGHIHGHDFLRDLRAFLSRRSGEAILLGEVNLPADEQRDFFGDEDGDELHMLFDFLTMQATWLALARGDARPLAKAWRARHAIPDEAAWATFLRNHDELTLDKLGPAERDEVFAAFGPDPDMQVYGRGLRRRLPPMLGGDQRWIRMAYSLMFAVPGTPTIFYGEELGMGENLAVDDRLAVRTPMQWTPGPTGGFTAAPADALVRPVPAPPFSPDDVNVRDARADPDSLLNWFERLVRLRKECPEIAWGTTELVPTAADAVDRDGPPLAGSDPADRPQPRPPGEDGGARRARGRRRATARPAAPGRAAGGDGRPGDAPAVRSRPPLAAARARRLTPIGRLSPVRGMADAVRRRWSREVVATVTAVVCAPRS